MEAGPQIADAAAEAVVERLGFDRAIFFAVAGDELIARSVYFGADEEWAARTLAVGQRPDGRPQLADLLVETESLRRRSAALVRDAQDDPHTPRALVEETRTRSYVAAPLLCEDQVVGFLHADHHFKAVDVSEADRDALAAFAGGVGLVLERLTLRRHLQAQSGAVRRLALELDDLAGGAPPVDLDLHPEADPAPRRIASDASVRTMLSARERQVLELMASGATNATIGRRLFITESTVKAHVHHILKKLGAKNRAAAVSRFHSGAVPGIQVRSEDLRE
jgi:DNA-binding CsgD family transcriptional regulator